MKHTCPKRANAKDVLTPDFITPRAEAVRIKPTTTVEERLWQLLMDSYKIQDAQCIELSRLRHQRSEYVRSRKAWQAMKATLAPLAPTEAK